MFSFLNKINIPKKLKTRKIALELNLNPLLNIKILPAPGYPS